MTNIAYASLLGLSGLLSLAAMGIVWKRRHLPGATALAVMLLAMLNWSWMYGLFWVVDGRNEKFLCLSLAYLGAVIISPAFLILCAQITGYTAWLTRRLYFALLVPVLVVLLLLWTNPFFGLFWGQVDFADPKVYLRGGLGFWLGVVYSALVAAFSIFLLLRMFVHGDSLRRKEAGIMMAAVSLPLLSSMAGFLHLSPFGGLDLTPVAFIVSVVIFALNLPGPGLSDLRLLARATLIDNIGDSVLAIDLHDFVVDFNQQALSFVNEGIADPIGKPAREVFSEWLRESAIDLTVQETHKQVKVGLEPARYFDVFISPITDKTRHVVGRLVIWRDITGQKQSAEEFQKFFLAVEQSNASIVITDADGRMEYVNPYFTKVTGFESQEVLGKTPRVLKSGKMPVEVYQSLWQTIKAGKEWDGEMLNMKKNGEMFWEYDHISPVIDDEGKITHFLAIKQDITLRKNTEAELHEANLRLKAQVSEIEGLNSKLHEESIRDGLTGLYNRKYMEESLERELANAGRTASAVSVVMIDVDRFKTVNDTFGHRAGDTLLQELGKFLQQNTRGGDLVSRYGGDEIVVVMLNAPADAAVQRAEEWRQAFERVRFNFGDILFSTSLSLGIASYTLHAGTAYDLLNAADRALYFAKENRNTLCLYDPETMA